MLNHPGAVRNADPLTQEGSMRMTGTTRFCSLFLVLLLAAPCWLAVVTAAHAQEEDPAGESSAPVKKPGSDVFGFEIGMQGAYSEGMSTRSCYYQPYADLFLKHRYLQFTAGISRFLEYQISDGEGEFETVNFTRPRAALSLYPHRVIELFGEYAYSTGDRRKHYYRSHEGTAGFLLDFDVVTLGGTCTRSRTWYHFKSDDTKDKAVIVYKSLLSPIPVRVLWARYEYYKKRYITQMEDLDVYPEFSWFVHETTSLDFRYEYRENIFRYVPEDYQYHYAKYFSHTGRVGVYSEPWRYLSLQAGVHAGADSESYIIAGGNAGLVISILDYARLSVDYMPEYYQAPKVDATRQKIIELVNLILMGRRKTRNPFLSSSDVGASFWNHGVYFGAAFTY